MNVKAIITNGRISRCDWQYITTHEGIYRALPNGSNRFVTLREANKLVTLYVGENVMTVADEARWSRARFVRVDETINMTFASAKQS